MHWFFDTEFNEDGRTIELISIGLVSETGQTYYAINADINEARIKADNPWVGEHVLPYLDPRPARQVVHSPWKPRSVIRDEIYRLVMQGPTLPVFWGYFADYDWVLFAQLWGKMIDLPKGFPQWCRDIKQDMHRLGVTKDMVQHPWKHPTEHHALSDAAWIAEAFRVCKRLDPSIAKGRVPGPQ
jgi:hypothetical protein